jgi:hypothetical protein
MTLSVPQRRAHALAPQGVVEAVNAARIGARDDDKI